MVSKTDARRLRLLFQAMVSSHLRDVHSSGNRNKEKPLWLRAPGEPWGDLIWPHSQRGKHLGPCLLEGNQENLVPVKRTAYRAGLPALNRLIQFL